MATEAELVARAQQGDDRAFAALVDPHRAMLETVCFRITGDRHEAEDALQQALLAAWQHLDRFEARAKFSTWLYRIAHNAALGAIRKKRPEPVDDIFETDPPGAKGHEEVTDDVHSVRWALAKIPPDFRAALVLREYADLSYEEIAEAQGIKLATVKTRIARARQAMAELLDIDRG
jgi:RNA polymerase sigma-70 factor (ECF subfamily)